jgi:uncharacterized RDD family membrane protein YckC
MLEIHTPEGITFSFPLAGPTTRFLAWAIDRACIALAYFILVTVIAFLLTPPAVLFGSLGFDLTVAMIMVAFFVLSIGYAIALEWFWRGQTIGKRLLHLRVMDEQGLQLEFSQIVIRNLMRFVDALPTLYFVGGAACLLSRKGQRLGDFAANTVVTHVRPPSTSPDLETVLAGKYNSFRQYPHLEARLRQRVSADEARIALQALLRRDALEPQARVALFEDIADHFRSLVAFPEEATFGMTDEQYVRNAVDVVFRRPGRTEQS